MSEEYVSASYTILVWTLVSLIIIGVSLRLIELIQEENKEIPRRIADIVLSYIDIAGNYKEEIPFSLPKLSYDYKVILNGSTLVMLLGNKQVLEVRLRGYITENAYIIVPDRKYVVLVKDGIIRLIEV